MNDDQSVDWHRHRLECLRLVVLSRPSHWQCNLEHTYVPVTTKGHLCSRPIEGFVLASVQLDIDCLQRVYGKERCYGYLTKTL